MIDSLPEPLFESRLTGLERLHRGKVRDIYSVDDEHLLIVASDRLSAFDVVLPDPIPGKGVVLTAVANFWFARLGGIVANHLTGIDPESVLGDPADRAVVRDRAVVVRRARPLPVEAVVRGYLGRSVGEINSALMDRKIFGGKDLSGEFPELGQSALYCVTERITQDDIHKLVQDLGECCG